MLSLNSTVSKHWHSRVHVDNITTVILSNTPHSKYPAQIHKHSSVITRKVDVLTTSKFSDENSTAAYCIITISVFQSTILFNRNRLAPENFQFLNITKNAPEVGKSQSRFDLNRDFSALSDSIWAVKIRFEVRRFDLRFDSSITRFDFEIANRVHSLAV